jgi:acetyl esterase/lipase
VVIHGGFWRAQFDRSHTGPQCAGFTSAGWAVASIEYRRVGAGGGWPTTFDDVALALDTVPSVIDRTTSGRVDTQNVVHVGHSAGGHLAVWAASRHHLPAGHQWYRPEPAPGLRGVVSLAGVLDLAGAATSALGDGAASELMGGGPADVPDRYSVADPLALTPADVPTMLIHGADDDRVPLEQSRRYSAAVGTGTDLVTLPGIEHFGLIDPLSPAWPAIVERVSTLLRALDGR